MASSLGGVERPISTPDDDLLDRKGFASKLSDALISPITNKATGVVVGLTGSWGSGKSSILNLVDEDIKTRHKTAIVVRFDPWLISARHDLISAFLQELSASLGVEKEAAAYRKIVQAIDDYSAFVTPVMDLAQAGLGTIAKAAFGGMAKAVKPNGSLQAARNKVIKAIEEANTPIVVLIDELDRVEDDEVRTMAQLVRSVADFPGVSYLLAYDARRVAEALGNTPSDADGRGRAYLEKIVQLTIPLPILLSNERADLLAAEIKQVHEQLAIPASLLRDEDHQLMIDGMVSGLIATPRDVKRLIGAYRALATMLAGEVDLADLLGFAALTIKTPQLVERMRSDPERWIIDPISYAESARRIDARGSGGVIMPKLEDSEAIAAGLLPKLFPALAGQTSRHDLRSDAIAFRRGLLTTLRLGILPGEASRSDVEELLALDETAATNALKKAETAGNIGAVIDRLSGIYPSKIPDSDLPFWKGAAAFLEAKEPSFDAYFGPKREIANALVSVMLDAVARRPAERGKAAHVFRALEQTVELSLTPRWVHHHFFVHGLYDARNDGGSRFFLSPEETHNYATTMADRWRSDLLSGKLLSRIGDAYPLYIMRRVGMWDDHCRSALISMAPGEIDTLAVIFFGSSRVTERSYIEEIMGWERFADLLRFRAKEGDVSDFVRGAIASALQDREAEQ